MERMFRLPDGRVVGKAEAVHYVELMREVHRRRELKRLDHERGQIIENCRTLHGFVKEFWYVLEPARPFVTGWALQAMCAHLEAVTDGDIQRLLMNVPPGMMKSLLMVFWTAWEWGPRGMPYIQVLTSSYSQTNVQRDQIKLRRLVLSDKFQALWPLDLRADTNAIMKFENTKNGFSEGRPWKSMTGGRADRVKVDDPHSTETAESDAERATAVRIFREGVSDRLNDVQTSAMVIIMQRLHEQDISAVALELDLGFVHLCLPMRFVEAKRCVTPIFTDPRQREGELLAPGRFPAAEVDKLERAKGPYAWAGQYQQTPTPRKGGIFDVSMIQRVQAIPASARRKVRGWDFGATDSAGDYTRGVLATMTPGESGSCYFLGAHGGQWGPGVVEREIESRVKADTPSVIQRMPQDPGSAGKAYIAILVKRLRGYPVKPERPTGDKETRAQALAAQVNVGNVYVVETGDPVKDAWIEEWMHELRVFPSGTHDDYVDASADAYTELALSPGASSVSDLSL